MHSVSNYYLIEFRSSVQQFWSRWSFIFSFLDFRWGGHIHFLISRWTKKNIVFLEPYRSLQLLPTVHPRVAPLTGWPVSQMLMIQPEMIGTNGLYLLIFCAKLLVLKGFSSLQISETLHSQLKNLHLLCGISKLDKNLIFGDRKYKQTADGSLNCWSCHLCLVSIRILINPLWFAQKLDFEPKLWEWVSFSWQPPSAAHTQRHFTGEGHTGGLIKPWTEVKLELISLTLCIEGSLFFEWLTDVCCFFQHQYLNP